MRVKPILPQNFVASVEIHVRYFFTAYVKILSYRIVQCSIPDVRKRSFMHRDCRIFIVRA
jgi:hypothetical protein